ncbi:phage replication initiation protein [Clostridium perfringens]|uniref:phage replication initiation protein n=1 Tax=Clostridium perfringens TaxID=1502 RepID=UPI0039ECE765
MAERRMFSKTIIDSDIFLDMPLSTQALYFHLSMRADDDGFVNNPRKIQRMVGCGDDDIKLLIAKQFIIPFESGICVIKHWRIHNYIRNDRYKPTMYQEEKGQLLLEENNMYELSSSVPLIDTDSSKNNVGIPNGYQMDTNGIPSDIQNGNPGEVRLGKDSIDNNISKDILCSTTVQRLIEKWNSLGLSTTLKTITPGTNRYKMLKARIKQYSEEVVFNAINEIPKSDFLMGKVKDFEITFDWFIKPNNFPKVLEGNYSKTNGGVNDGSFRQDNSKGKTTEQKYDYNKINGI